MTEFELADGLLDNTQVIAGRYIAHIAVPCRALEEAARWYSEVLGAQPVRILKDRVTFSFGGVFQLAVISKSVPPESTPRHIPGNLGFKFCRKKNFHECATTSKAPGFRF